MIERCPIAIDPTGADIHGEFARLRTQGQVAQVELPGGVKAWSILGYEAARQALLDERISKDAHQHWTAFVDGQIGEDFPMIGWIMMDNLTTAYGDNHRRLRQLTAGAFTRRRVNAMRRSIEEIVAELLDDLSGRTGGPVDLKGEFAHSLSSRVICDLFGVPKKDRAMVLRGGEQNLNTTLTPEEAAANVEAWHREMHEFVEGKRRSPGDDLTSDLIAMRDGEGSRLNDSELVGTLHLMLAAGTEPPTNLISKAIVALLSHPEQRRLLDEGKVSWSDVIEETLRVEAPVAHLPFRFAVEDIELDGVTIPKGDPILMGFAGVGRDPAVHGDTADRFDATRSDKTHLSFGLGAHRCIGASLALLEAEIALPALFDRFPDMSLAVPADELEPEVTFIMNGHQSVPVRLFP